VRRDANTLKLLMHDRRRKNPMLTEQIIADCTRINSLNIHVRNRTRLLRIERSVETNLRYLLQTVHPVTREISESRLLPFAAYAVMKQQRLTNRQSRRRRMSADLFKLANVATLLRFRRHQRP